jgi:hypothetical protein
VRSETVTATHSVTAAASCANGYVVGRQYRASAPDVQIVAQQATGCAAGQCRAFQVTAYRASETPFQLSVSVTCSG